MRKLRSSALTALPSGTRGDQDRQAVDDHVAADLGRELGQPQQQERTVAKDGERARLLNGLGRRDSGGRRLGDPFLARRTAGDVHRPPSPAGVASCASRGVGPTARLNAASPRLTNPTHPPLEGSAIEEHVPSAAPAAQPDVGAEAVDEPFLGTARVRPAQTDDVAEHEVDDSTVSGRHLNCHEESGTGGPA